MCLEEIKNFFELFSYVVTVIGLPFAIATFLFEKRKEREADEIRTFHQLDLRYISFLELCLNYPDLDIFDTPLGEDYKPTPKQIRQENAIFGIMIALFERAHFMFTGHEGEFFKNQEKGWEKYMKTYCYRKNFRRVWQTIGSQFDSEFYGYMNRLINERSEVASKEFKKC